MPATRLRASCSKLTVTISRAVFASFINIFQPECIVLGGGLAGYGEKLLAPLRRRIEKETFRGDTNTELVLASLGNDAGLVGAAML